MKTSLVCYFTFWVLTISFSQAQTIPSNQRVDWSKASLTSQVFESSNIVDVKSSGAKGDGITDDYPAIMDALNSLNGSHGVLYFPSGIYLLKSGLVLHDSLTITGQSPESSVLKFNLGTGADHCFQISKSQQTSFSSIIGGYLKDSYKVTISDTAIFKTGDFVEIRQKNGNWDTNPIIWADHSVGQLLKINNISGDTLFFDQALRFNYDSVLQPEIRKVQFIRDVKISCISIHRVDTPVLGGGNNIAFNYAYNCQVSGIRSNRSIGSHISVVSSSHIKISGNYIFDAFTFDGTSTRGYGVTLHHRTGDCLVTDNIFRKLRHAMVVKTGANGNVFSYNYSIEPTRVEIPTNAGGDISLHGHFAYANLFEHNIVQNIHIDQAWGPSGPFNTFFRNRADLYGIIISSGSVQSDRQNFIGNEVTNSGFSMGNYYLSGTGHFCYANNIKGVMNPSVYTILPDSSYYLTSTPEFWITGIPWPAIGFPKPFNSGTIPAKTRYLSGFSYTSCSDSPNNLNNSFLNEINTILCYPNPFSDKVFIKINSQKTESVKVMIFDQLGRKMIEADRGIQTGENTISIDIDFMGRNQFYQIQVLGETINLKSNIVSTHKNK